MVSATQQMPSRGMDSTKVDIVMGVLTITLTIGGKMKLKLEYCNSHVPYHSSIPNAHIFFFHISIGFVTIGTGSTMAVRQCFVVLELAVITSFFKLYILILILIYSCCMYIRRCTMLLRMVHWRVSASNTRSYCQQM